MAVWNERLLWLILQNLTICFAALRKKVFQGCACAIARDGKLLYEGYYGYADLAQKQPVTPGSLFRQASMTKLVTYTILMMLYEQGKVRMEQPLSDFFPEWAHKTKYVQGTDGSLREEPLSRPITVADATIMSCGLPYCFAPAAADCQNPVLLAMSRAMEPVWAKGHYRVREAIRAIAPVPVAFDPGTHWMYGFGSELIGGVVESLTGMPLYLAMRRLYLRTARHAGYRHLVPRRSGVPSGTGLPHHGRGLSALPRFV